MHVTVLGRGDETRTDNIIWLHLFSRFQYRDPYPGSTFFGGVVFVTFSGAKTWPPFGEAKGHGWKKQKIIAYSSILYLISAGNCLEFFHPESFLTKQLGVFFIVSYNEAPKTTRMDLLQRPGKVLNWNIPSTHWDWGMHKKNTTAKQRKETQFLVTFPKSSPNT